jgi:pyruvate,orthophosphate dikinase
LVRIAVGSADALSVNLARTAVDVVVPDEHAVLLEITAGWTGLQQATRELLREMHHRYVGWSQALTDLHRRAAGDLHVYNRHERGPEGLAVFCDLYAKIVEEAGDPQVCADALRMWMSYLEMIVTRSGPCLGRNLPVVREALERMECVFAASPDLAATSSPRLKRLVAALAAAPPDASDALGPALALLAGGLGAACRRWTAGDDPADWYRGSLPPGSEPGGLPSAVERISHRRLRTRAHAIAEMSRSPEGLASHVATLLESPDDGEIARGYVEAARAFTERSDDAEGLLGRIHWLLKVLARPELNAVHETALHDVGRCCSRILEEPRGREGLVREVFGLLRSADLPRTRAFTDLVARVGCAAMASGDPGLAAVLIDELLGLDFAYPEFSGFTSEWGVRVNPAHVGNIRAYLAIIGAAPGLSGRLVASLVVHLRVGGVFLADTDLFQRDVSALLGCDVGPVLFEVTQLLRVFPVYFREIGAEGHLRETSTRLDEIDHRRDPLCHFLRKQSHVECNPRLIALSDEILRFWKSGDTAPLRAYLPGSELALLAADGGRLPALHDDLAALTAGPGGLEELLGLGPDDVGARLAALPGGDPLAREKISLVFKVREELRRKYALDHSDVLARLREFRRVDAGAVSDLDAALGRQDTRAALEVTLTLLEDLQSIVLTPGETTAFEDIYHKRHIAAGIPSMYGTYREERFEAVGLILRLESLGTALFEQVIDDESLSRIDAPRLRKISGWLHQLQRALRIDGYRAQGLAHCLAMLDEAVEDPDTSLDQFLNIFQLMSRSVETSIRARILDLYDEPVDRALRQMLRRGVIEGGGPEDEAVLRHSEAFFRDLIAESFGLQRLDVLLGRVLHCLGEQVRTTPRARPPAGAPDPARSVLTLGGRGAGERGIVSLGNKAFMLSGLLENGFQVPPGFVLTTDLCPRARDVAIPMAERPGMLARIREEVARIEQATGSRLGDPDRPLLPSVRGGAPISMPGMLETFLNVGINHEVAAALAAAPRRAWAAWDAYRRFLQFWGMSHGMERDVFDGVMRDAKRRRSVAKKAEFDSTQMSELALEYRRLLESAGLGVVEDPFAQMLACIDRVHASWWAEGAHLYRRELQISDDWGTAAIVQGMVFGNLGPRSGTGVMLTRAPDREPDVIEPHGDFVIQGQGDDVVGGLVATFPISERQRLREPSGGSVSLERNFPELYAALSDVARALVRDQGMNHQEVEFTFEGDRRTDLYLLQTRDVIVAPNSVVAAFTPSEALDRAHVATGIGVGGGALSGRVALSAPDVAGLRDRFPGVPIILLRPDTVPDDIPLVLQVDGLLTAVGGATSHAAVAAKRLGKTCVVGTRTLEIDERGRLSRIGGRSVRTGDLLSISGIDGGIYLGAHPVTELRVRGRAQQ